jgi:hypothetical protein
MDARVAAYSVLTVIQDRVISVLGRGDGISLIPKIDIVGPTLLAQIQDRKMRTPDGLSLDLASVLDIVNVVDDLGEGDPENLKDPKRFVGRLREKAGDLSKKLDFGRIGSVRELAEKLFRLDDLPSGATIPGPLDGLLRGHLVLGISFVTTLRNLGKPELVEQIPERWKEYFFSDEGFKTVDKITIFPPEHGGLLAGLSGLSGPSGLSLQSLEGLKGMLKERSGERYVRDLIRITVEVAGDLRYELRERYSEMLKRAGDEDSQAKAERWFRGAASMAESLTTSAVEQALLGVAQFQTNALIAASAATYAGTAVRKATQHVFLAKIGVPTGTPASN